MSSSDIQGSQQQQVRDVKRVLQVLLPSLTPELRDMACNTFFASTSLTQTTQQRPQSSKFRLRRVDSGQLGNFNLMGSTNWGMGPQDKQFCGELKFSYTDTHSDEGKR